MASNWQNPPDDLIRSLLKSSKTIAVVGCSPSPERTSHQIALALKQRGYRIVPVHPAGGTILGESAYIDLEQVPKELGIDIVDVFRRPEEVVPVAEAATRIGARALWLQQGIRNDEAAAIAKKAGLTVIMDACIMVMHRLLVRDRPLA